MKPRMLVSALLLLGSLTHAIGQTTHIVLEPFDPEKERETASDDA